MLNTVFIESAACVQDLQDLHQPQAHCFPGEMPSAVEQQLLAYNAALSVKFVMPATAT